MASFIDTHCHLDAPEFGDEAAAVRQRASAAGVALCVIPAVAVFNFDTVRTLAHRQGDAYALGVHPLCTGDAQEADLQTLDAALAARRDDPRLVAVGEIGLDYFVPGLDGPKQEHFFHAQLQLARAYDLPVVIHVRRSVDKVLKHLRQVGAGRPWRGIAHAFNGSEQQAKACLDLGLKLGFGGTLTFERALQVRRLATVLPLDAIVMETDAPDIQPHWLYRTREAREAGVAQGRNEPAELPRIAQVLAELRGITHDELAQASTRNALDALPRLSSLLIPSGGGQVHV
ncbi:TatD family hydrolase [Variovorax sp. ZT4R33]|uniref:TatD family hydrolase n=1 Tax=Variovorax sp. ZT4R33 TaxID=3443743 RepID=UPI003F478DC6